MGCMPKQGGGRCAHLRVGAVLLAAGEGVRMGGVAKSLIRLQGVPLINRQLMALGGVGVDEVVVVTGHACDAVQAQVQVQVQVLSFPVTLAHNAGYAQGQQSSVRLGLSALSANLDAILIVLADQPLIGASDLTELIAVFKKKATGHIVMPMVGAQRGNPVVIDDVARAQVLASEANLGCRDLMDRNPEMVVVHQTRNTHFITDLDTLDDMAQLAKSTGWTLELPAAETTA